MVEKRVGGLLLEDSDRREVPFVSVRQRGEGGYVDFGLDNEVLVRLTLQQAKVLILSSAGLLDQDIAKFYVITQDTVDKHQLEAYKKLGNLLGIKGYSHKGQIMRPWVRRNGFIKPEVYENLPQLSDVKKILEEDLPPKLPLQPTFRLPSNPKQGIYFLPNPNKGFHLLSVYKDKSAQFTKKEWEIGCILAHKTELMREVGQLLQTSWHTIKTNLQRASISKCPGRLYERNRFG